MKYTAIAAWAALITGVVPVAYSGVDFWEVVKGEIYEQSADHTAPAAASNWLFFAYIETDDAGDATSIVLEGGNIVGAHAFEQDETEWELLVQYPSKAAMDAELPADGNFSLILNGAGGSVTQSFSFGPDNFSEIPYLTGSDFSTAFDLDVSEPFELNWNDPGNGAEVAVQIQQGTLLDGDEVLYQNPEGNGFSGFNGPNGLLLAGTNYTGAIEFISGTNFVGSGFSAEGNVSFNRLTTFPIQPAYKAVSGDDFSNSIASGSNWYEAVADDGQALAVVNDRLQWSSLPGVDNSIVWKWTNSCLSVTQDWSVALDVNCLIDSAAMTNRELWFGLALLENGEFDDLMTMEYLLNEYGAEVKTGALVDDSEVLEVEVGHDLETVSFKFSYDADTRQLFSSYSFGGDYTVQTNVSVDIFLSLASDEFCPALFFGGTNALVNAGQVYVDNFRIYGETPLSNDVSRIELEYLRGYGFPNSLQGEQANWYFMETLSSHRVSSVNVLTAAGDHVILPEGSPASDGGNLLITSFEAEEPITEPWDPANDGDWTITFGFTDGTFQSTVVPFTQTNGAAIPVINKRPFFTAPDPLHDVVTNTSSLSVTFNSPDVNANFVEISEWIEADQDVERIRFYSDGLPDVLGVAPASDGPLSTSAATISVENGTHEWLLSHGWGRSDYNEDGIGFIVVKQTESIYMITVTSDMGGDDMDGDNMDDDWEIDYFGGTNVVDGGAYEDFDKDGMLNIEEFIAGVNPTNDNSVFAIEEPGPSPEGFVINWISAPGREYAVFWTKDLADDFGPVTPGYLPHPQNSYTDKVHTAESCGFYIIDVRLEN